MNHFIRFSSSRNNPPLQPLAVLLTGLIAAAALLAGGGLPALWPLLLAAGLGAWVGGRRSISDE